MEDRRKILFLCTGNSCRSQMGEAILKHVGGDRFEALSAGSHPAGYIHPLAERALERLAIPLSDQFSKSWDEFADRRLDAVITLCDEAAGEVCPNWPGRPIRAHWSLPDPSFQGGSEEDRTQFAVRVAERLLNKVQGLTALDWSLPRGQLEERFGFLGEI